MAECNRQTRKRCLCNTCALELTRFCSKKRCTKCKGKFGRMVGCGNYRYDFNRRGLFIRRIGDNVFQDAGIGPIEGAIIYNYVAFKWDWPSRSFWCHRNNLLGYFEARLYIIIDIIVYKFWETLDEAELLNTPLGSYPRLRDISIKGRDE